MIKGILKCVCLGLFAVLLGGCKKERLPLSRERFTALLIDMHRVDGTLAVNKGMRGNDELGNYAYYNELFKKYGITRADFDSCMYYYSAQTVLFSKMYDVVIDTLNRQLTGANKIINELKANDSVNYFPVSDTIRLDSVYTVTVDSIFPGLYKFSTVLQFDSAVDNRTRRIASCFLSADGRDTLHVRDIVVVPDTNVRTYSWSQYADSLCSRLQISYMEVRPVKDRPDIFRRGKKGKKQEKPVKEKVYQLEGLGGKAWNNCLFHPYVSRANAVRLKQSIRRK